MTHLAIQLGEEDHERFWRNVVIPSEGNRCWGWKGKHNKDGYPMFSIGRRWFRASRIAWTIVNGPLVPGENVLHRCDNPGCPRPSHLFTGSQADNVADMIRKGRARRRSMPGTTNPNSRLSESDVREIRAIAAREPRSQRKLARAYGVSGHTIWAIIHRKTWRHI